MEKFNEKKINIQQIKLLLDIIEEKKESEKLNKEYKEKLGLILKRSIFLLKKKISKKDREQLKSILFRVSLLLGD